MPHRADEPRAAIETASFLSIGRRRARHADEAAVRGYDINYSFIDAGDAGR